MIADRQMALMARRRRVLRHERGRAQTPNQQAVLLRLENRDFMFKYENRPYFFGVTLFSWKYLAFVFPENGEGIGMFSSGVM